MTILLQIRLWQMLWVFLIPSELVNLNLSVVDLPLDPLQLI